jgi:uncharacterized protein with HEPN domain
VKLIHEYFGVDIEIVWNTVPDEHGNDSNPFHGKNFSEDNLLEP